MLFWKDDHQNVRVNIVAHKEHIKKRVSKVKFVIIRVGFLCVGGIGGVNTLVSDTDRLGFIENGWLAGYEKAGRRARKVSHLSLFTPESNGPNCY